MYTTHVYMCILVSIICFVLLSAYTILTTSFRKGATHNCLLHGYVYTQETQHKRPRWGCCRVSVHVLHIFIPLFLYIITQILLFTRISLRNHLTHMVRHYCSVVYLLRTIHILHVIKVQHSVYTFPGVTPLRVIH